MEGPNWMIHYVQGHYCAICGELEPNPTEPIGFANAHTHGFINNGHEEICIPFDIGMEATMLLLNTIGFRIREENLILSEGISDNILAGGMRVNFYRCVTSLYMLLPDPNGVLPGEPGCEFPYNQQIEFAERIEREKAKKLN